MGIREDSKTAISEKTSFGELFDKYEDMGYDFFNIEYLMKEAEKYSKILEEDHARLIMYSIMKELQQSREKLNEILDIINE